MPIKRERLVHPLLIVLFGAMIAVVLALMLPDEQLIKRLKNASPNALSVAYLEAWLRIRHDDLDLVNVLAHQYIQSGRLQEADPLVARLLQAADPAARRNALLLQIQLTEQRAYALQPEDPQRALLLQTVAQALTKAEAYAWDTATLESLARKARALNLSALSMQLYGHLAQQDPAHASSWQALAGELALAGGQYREAALAAFAAQAASKSLAEQRSYFLAGLQALQSGNLLQLAMTEAQERAGPLLENDAETLRFLTKLARSANRPDLAEKYAARLMNVIQAGAANRHGAAAHGFMLAGSPRRSAARDLVYLDGVRGNALRRQLERKQPAGWMRVAATESAPHNGKPAGAGQDQQKNASINDDLELIYNAMLANKNLKEALRVAETASRRLPGDPLWMQRVATINEWSGRAPQALQAWLAMARATNNPEAWQAVLRLAPGLNDEMGYLEALLHQVGKAATELLLVDQIVAAYERLDQAANALAFLSSQMARSTRPREILERYAALADRAGKDQLAMQAYQRLNREFGPQPAYALKLANIYNARADFDAACEALISARAKVAPQDAAYWRILERAAVRAGRDEVAKDAARHLIASNTASAVDMENAVTLWRDSPIDAARLAEAAFRQRGSAASLQEAVYFYSRAKAWPRIESLLASLTPEQAATADKAPEFLMAKAEFLRETGRNDEALKVLRAAIAQDDSASEVRAAFLWMLADRGSYNELSAALTHWRHDAENDSLLWGPYAAGYVKLSNQAAALHFFQKQGSEKLEDPLWALAYADALENFGQADRAWNIRHQTWLKISQHRSAILGPLSPVGATGNGDDQDEQIHAELRARSVALSQAFAGADVSRSLLLQVLRRRSADRKSAAPETGAANPAIAHVSTASPATEAIGEDVALAWAMSNESYDQASLWLAQRYARQLERPAYAEVAIALANDDLSALDKLLADNPDRIPLLNRIDANLKLERNSEARRLEFAGIDGNPDNDELQARLRETALQIASYVEPRASEFRQSPLRYTETGITVKEQLDDRLSLIVQASQRNQHSDNATQLINIPHHDRLLTLGLDWKSGDTDVLAEAGSRNAVKSLLTARIKAAWDQRTPVSWNAALGYNQEATESAILRVGGVKDSAVLGVNWRFSSHDFLQVQGEAARYYAQDRTYVGSGTVFQADVGHHFRLEYPDFTLRAVFTRADYHGNGNGDPGSLFGRLSPTGMAIVADILPSNFTQAGLVFAFGTNLQDSYSHAWRPFLEVGMLHDTIAGWTLSGRVGMAGSVLGNDQGMLYYTRERSAGSGDAGASEIGMRYRWYY